MRLTIVNLILATCLLPPAGAVAQQPGAGADASQMGPQANAPHRIGAPLPPPISPADLQRFGEFLTLAAPQQALLNQAYGRYMERLRQIIEAGSSSLDQLNVQAGVARRDHPRTFQAARASKALYDKQGDMRREIEQADGVLFAELDSVLAETQKPDMARVRNQRQRGLCTTQVTWMMRPARIDLTALVRQLTTDPDILQAVDGVLRDYEAQITPLILALDRSMTDVRIPMLELVAWSEREENDQPVPPEALRERSIQASAKRRAMLAESVRLQRRIADLNEATLPSLMQALPADRAEALLQAYRQLAFPVVYQDQFRVHRACAQILESNAIDQAQRTAIESLCGAYTASYDAINAEMERRYRDWCEEFASTLASRNYEPYRQKMRQLREDRWRLSLNLVRQLESLLPGVETGADLPYLQQALEQAIKQAAGDRFPGQ